MEAIVGRNIEIRAATRFLDRLERSPQVLVVDGEPGIGKSTLLRAILEQARHRGMAVLVARPSEFEARLSWSGLSDLLDGVESRLLEALPPVQAEALGAALLRERPDTGPTLKPRSGDQRAVFAGTRALLAALSARQPVLIGIDDVQWLDSPSQRALAYLARRLADNRIGLLLTEREETAVPLLALAPDPKMTHRLSIGPLSRGELQRMMTDRFGFPLPRRTLLAIHDASHGNPLFALELVQTMTSDTIEDDPQLPSRARPLIARRIASLPRQTRLALLRAACLRRPTTAIVRSGLAPAEASGVVTVDAAGRITFIHPLYATVVYELATLEERRNAHRVLARLVTDVEERALHLSRAARGRDEHVAAALESASHQARGRGALDAASELMEQAVKLTPAEDIIALNRRAIAAAQDSYHAGALTEAGSLLGGVLERSSISGERVRALHLLARVAFREHDVIGSIELFKSAASEAVDDPQALAAIDLDLAFALASATGEYEQAEPFAIELLRLAPQISDRAVLAEVLAVATMIEFLVGHGIRESRLTRALDLEDPDHLVPAEFTPTLVAGFLRFYTGDFDAARLLLSRLRTRLREHGQEGDLPFALGHFAWMETWSGNLERARQFAGEALDAATLTESETGIAVALAFGAYIEAFAGDVQRCKELVDECVSASARAGMGVANLWAFAALGFLHLSLGDVAAAWANLAPLVAFADRHSSADPIRSFFLPDAIEALIGVGEIDEALRLTERYLARGVELDRSRVLALGWRCRALIAAARGQLEDARNAVQHSLVHQDGFPAPIERGRTLVALGQIERRARQKLPARKAFQEAITIFDAVGAAIWKDRATAELLRSEARSTAPDQLTESERRIAVLAASGLRNHEVATRLYLSPKTVEANLARVYRKLGIRSRAELGALLG